MPLNKQNFNLVSRTDARLVECPYCGAWPRKKCVGARSNVRESNHRERVEAYKAAYR